MRRIVIMGQTCAGKSTVARILSQRLDLPLIDLDAIHWCQDQPWTERPMDEKRRLVAEAASGEAWVIDGFSNFMREPVLGRADTVVWIDLPIATVARRIVPRTLRRWLRRESVCGNNRENPRQLFARDGLLRYLRRSGKANEAKYAKAFDDFQNSGARGFRFDATASGIQWATEQRDGSTKL